MGLTHTSAKLSLLSSLRVRAGSQNSISSIRTKVKPPSVVETDHYSMCVPHVTLAGALHEYRPKDEELGSEKSRQDI